MNDISWPKATYLDLHTCWEGKGDQGSFRRALVFVVNELGAVNEQSFVPGASDQTAFNEGRRWVARQIQRALTVPMKDIVTEERLNAVDGSGTNTFAERARSTISANIDRAREAVRTGVEPAGE